MTAAEATRIALEARAAFSVPDDFTPGTAERRIVEIGQAPSPDKLPEPGPVRDVTAWVVQLFAGESWTEFAVSEKTGKVVRFRRSR
jgi:hypothetical protein